MIDSVTPKRRPQDNVKIGINEPQEEDFAMCSLGGQANLLARAFPRNHDFYQRYMTLDELSVDDLSLWKASYQLFLKKLTYVASIANYKKNVLPELPDNLRRCIHREWKRCSDEWGYAA